MAWAVDRGKYGIMVVVQTARVDRILKNLDSRYPRVRCSLDYRNPRELLVATILSAQCTDERVNTVTKTLFKKYKTAKDYATVPLAELEQNIRSTGFYRNKAKAIQGAAKMIVEKFDGKVPSTMEELVQLPGVARKTANVVLGNAFNKQEGVVVDTHVSRVTSRLGLTKQKTPEKIEKDLMEIIPRKKWTTFAHQVIAFGREICKAPKPKCPECPMKSFCPSAKLFFPEL